MYEVNNCGCKEKLMENDFQHKRQRVYSVNGKK